MTKKVFLTLTRELCSKPTLSTSKLCAMAQITVFKLSCTFALKGTVLSTFPVFMRAMCFSEREIHFLTKNVYLTLTRVLCPTHLLFTSIWCAMEYITLYERCYTFALKGTELSTIPVFIGAKWFSEREKHVLTHNVFLTLTRELCSKQLLSTSKWCAMA